MAVKIAQLLVGIAADTKQLKKSLADSKREFQGFARSVRNVFAGIGVTFATSAVIRGIRQTTDEVDRLTKATRALGIAVKDIGTLEVLSARGSVDIRSTFNLIQRQTRRIAEAAAGGGEAVGALSQLGFTDEALQQLNRLDPVAQFAAIADAMKEVNNQNDKLRLGFKLYDSEGVRPALELMSQGAEGIRAAAEAAREMGLAITPQQAKNMEDFATAWAELGLEAGAAKRELIINIAPAAVEFMRWARGRESSRETALINAMTRPGTFTNSMFEFFGGTRADPRPIQPHERRFDLAANFGDFMRFQIERVRSARGGGVTGLEIMQRGMTAQTVARAREGLIVGAGQGIASAIRGISQGMQGAVRGVALTRPFVHRAGDIGDLVERFMALPTQTTGRGRLLGPNQSIMGGSSAGFSTLRENFRRRENKMEEQNEERNELLQRIHDLLAEAARVPVAEMF